MEFWEQRLFKEIAATRSMSRGAEHCGVSQSAASQHVQEVERRLGVTLLDRTKRPLELTQAGRIYSEFCRDVLRREEEFSMSLESLKGDVEGTVRVVSIYSAGLSEMSRLGEQFAAKYPTAQLHVEYMRPDKIYDAVRDDAADLGLVSYPESEPRDRGHPVARGRDAGGGAAQPPVRARARKFTRRTSTATPSSASTKTCASAASWTASCARRASRSTSPCTSTTFR